MIFNKKILVLGGGGFVGSSFIDYLKSLKCNFIAPTHKQLDVLDFPTLNQYLKDLKPSILINFIAFTDLEKAERERNNKQGLVWMTNVLFVKKLVKFCQKFNIFLIHLSTDAVFPGSKTKKGPYSEKCLPNFARGLSWYGETKRQAESFIVKHAARFAIVRINYPFGNVKSRKDFATKLYSYIISEKALFVDQYFNPTYLLNLNQTLQKLIQLETTGIFHVATKDITTPYAMGQLIKEFKGVKRNIRKGSVKDLISIPGKPTRLIFGGLNTALTEQRLNIKFYNLKESLKLFYTSPS